MTINETELEARIDGLLATVFPTFKEVKVEHQRSFTIKFGHHNVQINHKDPKKNWNRAIFDILLTAGGTNIILLELKKQSLKLTDADRDQGISYARLVHPMPPITLISNGTENRFFNTYTKEKIDKTSVDMAYLMTLLDNSFDLAVNDFKNAVNLLLNRDPQLFSKVINQITEDKFLRLQGEINDFSKPISPEFLLKRDSVNKVEALFLEGSPLVGVVGSAFAGKTNLLYQFFLKVKNENNFMLYLDCNDHNYSILQQLANHFTQNAKILITKDKIREWLINSLMELQDGKFYLLIDNFNNDIPEDIKSEIIELIDIFKGVNHHTLYTIDEFNFKKIAFVDNRGYKTIIGEQSRLIQLDELNDSEFDNAHGFFFTNFKIGFERGGHYTPEYREPRILRHLLTLYAENIKEKQFVKIDAVPNLELLNSFAANKTYTRQIQDLYKKIAFLFFAEKDYRKTQPDLSIMAVGSGAITTNIFREKFPQDFDALIRSSVVVIRELENGISVIYPKFQELIAVHSIEVIGRLLVEENKNGKSIENLCDILIDQLIPVPFCDIVGAGVLQHIALAGEDILFSDLVKYLLEKPPVFKKLKGGTEVLMYSEGLGHARIAFEDDMEDGGFVDDFLPYPILSQLAAFPMGEILEDGQNDFSFHLSLLNKIGSSKDLIRRADVRSLKNMKQLATFELQKEGFFISGEEGIIEPIVQSILKCFCVIPHEIEKLYQSALMERNTNLLYRLYLALRTMESVIDPDLARISKDFMMQFNSYFNDFLAGHLADSEKDPQEREALKARLLAIISKNKEEDIIEPASE